MAAAKGLEPLTYGLTVRRSTNWTTRQYNCRFTHDYEWKGPTAVVYFNFIYAYRQHLHRYIQFLYYTGRFISCQGSYSKNGSIRTGVPTSMPHYYPIHDINSRHLFSKGKRTGGNPRLLARLSYRICHLDLYWNQFSIIIIQYFLKNFKKYYWQAPKDLNPNQVGWNHSCYHYTKDPYGTPRRIRTFIKGL